MYTIGVILSAMPFPKCKPSLDMFINPSLEIITNILAIEVNLYFIFMYSSISIIYLNVFNVYRKMVNLLKIDQCSKIESGFLVH